MNYKNQLLHPNWKAKRIEILIRDDYKCRECGRSDCGLEVHHGYYEKGSLAWEYENKYLHTLCERCHKSCHYYMKELMRLSGEMLPSSINFLFKMLYYLNQRAIKGNDYDKGDLDCYADWIIENIKKAKGITDKQDCYYEEEE